MELGVYEQSMKLYRDPWSPQWNENCLIEESQVESGHVSKPSFKYLKRRDPALGYNQGSCSNKNSTSLGTQSGTPTKESSRRETRTDYNRQFMYQEVCTGTLVTYALNKRFGFIKRDDNEARVFVCEDDLVLSKINLKKFKDQIREKHQFRFSFNVICYIIGSKINYKATSLALIE